MLPDIKSKIPQADLKHKIRQILTKKLWDQNTHQIRPVLKERKLDPENTRTEETALGRLSIGHTKLTHSFILKDEPPPRGSRGNQYTVHHILIECTHTRKHFYNINSMKELFRKIDPKNILNFLKRIGLLLRMEVHAWSIRETTFLCTNKYQIEFLGLGSNTWSHLTVCKQMSPGL